MTKAKNYKSKGENTMLKTLNKKEMMTVNGGGYYVPVYVYMYTRYILDATGQIVHTTYDGKKTVGTRWVASGSGITSINGGSEYRYVHV